MKTLAFLTLTGRSGKTTVALHIAVAALVLATGRAVTQFESYGKAAAEIRALWRYLKECMNGKAGRKPTRKIRAA